MVRKIMIGSLLLLLTACYQVTVTEEEPPKTLNEEELHLEEQLFELVRDNDLVGVRNIVKDIKNIDITDKDGNTAVMIATMQNNVDIVQALIQAGADINIQNDREDNVLLYAGAEGLLDIVKLAVEAGADTTLTNRYGGIALIPAADRGHVDIVKYLLEASDSNVNHINNLHWTALLEAIILGDGGESHQKIVELLLAHDADVQLSDGEGITPLQHAKKGEFKEIEQLLIEAGARE